MNGTRSEGVAALMVKTAAWFAAWFGSVKLADVQAVVAILSGLVVGTLAALNAYVVWRDKIRGRK